MSYIQFSDMPSEIAEYGFGVFITYMHHTIDTEAAA
jgi:hypothetical protein